MFETNQLLQRETEEQAVVKATAGQLLKLLQKDIVVYLANGQELDAPSIFRTPDSNQCELVSENRKSGSGGMGAAEQQARRSHHRHLIQRQMSVPSHSGQSTGLRRCRSLQ